MPGEQFANLAQTTLNGSINNSVTSLTVASASGFPATGNFRIIVDSEIMLVTAVSGANFTVTRGYESSTAASHASGVNVTLIITAGIARTFNRAATRQVDARDFGVVMDCRRVDDITASSGGTTITSGTAAFTSADVGKVINIYDRVNNNYIARTTIASVTNSSVAALTATASNSATSGNAIAYIGTDNASKINDAFTAAGNLVDSTAIDDNQPLGNSRVTVVFPVDPDYPDRCCLFASQLSVPTNVGIDADVLMVSTVGTANNNTNGQANRTWSIVGAPGAFIRNLRLDLCYGMGIKIGTNATQSQTEIGCLEIWSGGGNYDGTKTPKSQIGLQLLGNDYFVNRYWVKGSNIGLDLFQCNDVMMNHVFLIGCSSGVVLAGCEEIQCANSQFDTCSYTAMQVDSSHGVRWNGHAFSINTTSLTSGLHLGQNDGTNALRNFIGNFSFNRSGGDAVVIGNVTDCKLDLNLSNAGIFNGSGAAITNAIKFATYTPTGQLLINANIDAGITTTSGTVYGTLMLNHANQLMAVNRIVLAGKTANFTAVIPANCYIIDVFIRNTTASAITGNLKVGTTSGATDVISSQAVAGNALLMVTNAALLKRVFSVSAAQTLYFQAITAWNSANITVEIVYGNL
ncbi:hypothetical protein [Phenylobacterium sp.]|uniref:hypothetical protein n=1 Tax=Phenylobacterium sp. TaxID=1871053 RepID=UPI00301D5136